MLVFSVACWLLFRLLLLLPSLFVEIDVSVRFVPTVVIILVTVVFLLL